jgi:hypothetical protein
VTILNNPVPSVTIEKRQPSVLCILLILIKKGELAPVGLVMYHEKLVQSEE